MEKKSFFGEKESFLSNSENINRHMGINLKFNTMTKVLIVIGFALTAILLIGTVLSFIAPKKISITSKQFISASKETVYDQLRYMRNFPHWSPFKESDPDQKTFISGPDGQIGATFNWEGVKEKSKGTQTVTSLKENEKVEIKCNITEPFHSSPTFSYTIKEVDGGIEVIQNFDVEMPIPSNVFGLLLNLKEKMKSTNEHGLALLKRISEENNLSQN